MRSELAGMVADFFNTLDISKPVDFTTEERDKLIHLAVFTTRCRSAVERDSYVNREISLIPGAESPTRPVKVLAQLLRGLQVIGVTKERAWELVEKTALDSMPALRQKVIFAMLETDIDTVTSDLATRLGYPTNTTRRTLEDLACYGVIKREARGAGNADFWTLTDWTRKTYQAATRTLPEIREGYNTSLINNSNNRIRICGKVAANDTGELPDCPACGRNEWTYSPDGELVCPCGKSLKDGGR
jgi:DNA-binding MarR family transcriptional regulator